MNYGQDKKRLASLFVALHGLQKDGVIEGMEEKPDIKDIAYEFKKYGTNDDMYKQAQSIALSHKEHRDRSMKKPKRK